MSTSLSVNDIAAVKACQETFQRIRKELAKVIVGQDDVIEQVLLAMFV